jgi:Tfp pilus assembly protein PilF
MTWQLLRENSPRGEFARRRLAVLAAFALFSGGLLIALGLGTLLLFLVGIAAIIGGAYVVFRFGERPGRITLPDLSGVRRRAGRGAVGVRTAGARVVRDMQPAAVRVRDASSRVARDVQPAVTGFVGRAAERARTADWGGWPYSGASQRPVQPTEAADEHRRAIELNTRGAQLRSEGHPEEAAEQHRQALAIFRKLGDRRGEAPTLNSLALALDAAGDTDAAVERFEQALNILRDEGDERHEGRVIANYGFTMMRHGEDDRARDLFETALRKLDPESRTAQQVVEQLRRAS